MREAWGSRLVVVVVALAGLMISCALSESAAGRSHKPSSHDVPLYVRMADTALQIWNSSGPGKEVWNYERGVLLYGIQQVWRRTNDPKYLAFVQDRTDAFVTADGNIPTYNKSEYNLDNIRSGTVLLFLWKQTGNSMYKKAAHLLRDQLKTHPRTKEGGFWHKLIYPYQMWLDGLFMAEPFYAQYALLFKEPGDFDDIALQFTLMEKRARDAKTGLLYHGYDESRQQAWADPETGRSPSFWGRAVGWYFMALVDTLDFFPSTHAKREDLVVILQRLAEAVAKVQDPVTGVWWEVLDQGGRQGNYLESSASCMFVYGLAKGVERGYLSESTYKPVYSKGFQGIRTQFVQPRSDGGVDLNSTVSVGGLGGSPYRNGTYEYYLSEDVVTNDAKGVGPFLLASLDLLS
ncbi:hypothetical protein L7F22_061389 [Adiantum nelumboides]|nr:hypothetical protein [Adiantum nelumboides]